MVIDLHAWVTKFRLKVQTDVRRYFNAKTMMHIGLKIHADVNYKTMVILDFSHKVQADAKSKTINVVVCTWVVLMFRLIKPWQN